jgi:hypothetical protein
MKDKEIEAIMFAVNEKANEAAKKIHEVEDKVQSEFWHGQYMAFNEVYSLLKNTYENNRRN